MDVREKVKKTIMEKYCITNWGAVLKVKGIKDGLVDVSDPDAVDAGMYISTKEVDMFWLGFRPKDMLPEIGQSVEVFTHGRCLTETRYTKHGFEYDLQCEEGVAIVGMGTPDRVVLWHELDTPF